MIDEKLTDLLARLRGQVPDDIVYLYESDLAAGEAQLALEDLFDELEMNDVRIDRETADAIVALAKWFEITRYGPDDVYALLGE